MSIRGAIRLVKTLKSQNTRQTREITLKKHSDSLRDRDRRYWSGRHSGIEDFKFHQHQNRQPDLDTPRLQSFKVFLVNASKLLLFQQKGNN